MGHCVPSWNTVQCRRCFPAVLHCAAPQGVAGVAHASFPPCHCVQDLQHEYNATATALLQAVRERLPPLDVPAMLDRVQVRFCLQGAAERLPQPLLRLVVPAILFPRVQMRVVVTNTDGNVRNKRQRCL